MSVCECGTRLAEKQIKAGGKYCCIQCRGKYHQGAPKERGFGFEVPSGRNANRLSVGFRDWLDQRGGVSGGNSKRSVK